MHADLSHRAGRAGAPPRPRTYWQDDVLFSEEAVRQFESVPLHARGLPASTYEMLKDGCSIDPGKIAVVEIADGTNPGAATRQLTHGELLAGVNRTANLLLDLGVGREDVVSVLMPAVLESQFVLWGAQAVGIVHPANWMLEPEILLHMFRAAGTKVLVVYVAPGYESLWGKLERIVPAVASIRAVVRVGRLEPPATVLQGICVVDYEARIGEFKPDRVETATPATAESVASLFHTGGTTGTPKLAVHSHANQVFWTWASKSVSGFGREEVRLVGVPIFHVAGALVSCFGPLARGAQIVLLTSSGFRDPTVIPNFWRIAAHYRATTITLVPTLVNQLLSVSPEGEDLGSITYAACSTAPLSRAAAEAFFVHTGLRLRESYGMTETTAVVTVSPPGAKFKVGSSGLRLPYTEIRIARAGSGDGPGETCRPGEPGRIFVRGPVVFRGYLAPHGSEPVTEDGWLDTGDLGFVDEEAWLWVTGRAKDLIIRGGHNIDPRMVEEALLQCEGVREVAVVGGPDLHAGEVPVAYVTLAAGAMLLPQDILRFAQSRVPERAAVPKHCHILPALPRSAVGKVLKNQLRGDAIRFAIGSMLEHSGLSAGVDVRVHDAGAGGLEVDLHVDASHAVHVPQIQQALRGLALNTRVHVAQSCGGACLTGSGAGDTPSTTNTGANP